MFISCYKRSCTESSFPAGVLIFSLRKGCLGALRAKCGVSSYYCSSFGGEVVLSLGSIIRFTCLSVSKVV